MTISLEKPEELKNTSKHKLQRECLTFRDNGKRPSRESTMKKQDFPYYRQTTKMADIEKFQSMVGKSWSKTANRGVRIVMTS